MDASGKLIRESKVETEPEAIGALLHTIGGPYKRVGLEAGPLSQWLYSGLAVAGYPVICVETRHMKPRSRRRSTRPIAMTPAASRR